MTDLQAKTPEQKIREAGDARHVIDNPVFQAAKKEIYDKLRQVRRTVSTNINPEQIADLVRVEQVADQFFDYFELVLQSGWMAEAHLEQDRAQAGLKERGLALFRTIGRNVF
jgi:glutamine synthetase adenylyltransferase